MRNGRLPSFVLVHGAWHDARAWDQLRAVLDGRGYGSIAVDLPSEDVAVGASGYARVIAAAADRLGPEPVVVVGHSMAGIAIPLVPALAPVRHLVFLAALIPEPGRTMADVQAREPVLGDTSAVARSAPSGHVRRRDGDSASSRWSCRAGIRRCWPTPSGSPTR